jgi:hypothetical protein
MYLATTLFSHLAIFTPLLPDFSAFPPLSFLITCALTADPITYLPTLGVQFRLEEVMEIVHLVRS